MFMDSYAASRDQYRGLLRSLRERDFSLSDTDLDTGRPPARGVNELGDETYVKWLSKLQDHEGTTLPPALRRALAAHYASIHSK
jgi:Leu/Phe-tRNA-protein transferase